LLRIGDIRSKSILQLSQGSSWRGYRSVCINAVFPLKVQKGDAYFRPDREFWTLLISNGDHTKQLDDLDIFTDAHKRPFGRLRKHCIRVMAWLEQLGQCSLLASGKLQNATMRVCPNGCDTI